MNRFTFITAIILGGCSFHSLGLGDDEGSTGDSTTYEIDEDYPDAGKRTAPMEPSDPPDGSSSSSTSTGETSSSSSGAIEGSNTSTGETSGSTSTGGIEGSYGPCETDSDCGPGARCRVGLHTAVCAPVCEGQNCAPFEEHEPLCAVDACLIVCTANDPCPQGMICSLSSCTWSTL